MNIQLGQIYTDGKSIKLQVINKGLNLVMLDLKSFIVWDTLTPEEFIKQYDLEVVGVNCGKCVEISTEKDETTKQLNENIKINEEFEGVIAELMNENERLRKEHIQINTEKLEAVKSYEMLKMEFVEHVFNEENIKDNYRKRQENNLKLFKRDLIKYLDIYRNDLLKYAIKIMTYDFQNSRGFEGNKLMFYRR